jgi:GNAT superfamily N-acetyltransferase
MTPSPIADAAAEPCRHLSWDSEFFGLSMAAVNGARLTDERADAIDRWAAAEGARCLFFFADPADAQTIRVAERRGYALTDVRMTYACPLREWTPVLPASALSGVRLATEADLPALKAIARTAHRNTRFYRDGRFPHDRCDALYELWIERSCAGWADRVFVVGAEGDPLGYVTVHREPGDLRLVAVRPDAWGQGLGRVLYQAAIAWLAESGAESAHSPTQVFNLPAQRLFQSVNLRLSSVAFIYHRWLDQQP